MKNSHWEANSFSASREIPWILWNLKVHNSMPPVPILSQINPVQILQSYLRYPLLYYIPIYAYVF
jgi:hypothetical protein